jgi:hypothetical protein
MTLAMPATPAAAKQIAFPEIDVKAACAATSSPDVCIAMQNRSKAEAARLWPAKRDRQVSCTKLAMQVPGVSGGSYVALQSCLEGS